MKCVNRSHKDFKNLARHYGLSNDQLEVFTHKYWIETGNEDSFPTSVYIRAQLGNFPYQEPSKSVRTLWENKYSEPSEYTSEKEWRNAYNEAKKYFPEYAIVTHKNGKDAFVLSVRKPVANLASEISSIIAYPVIGSKEHSDYKIVTDNIVKETQDNINASAAKRLRNALNKQEQDKQIEYISNETGIDFSDFQMAIEAKRKPTTFTFKDGTTVNSPFLVNQQQKEALNEMNDFVHSDDTSMTLSGYAGTGKTSIMQLLAQKMAKENRSIVFSATTNKAASVLKSRVEKAGFDATTLYKAFGFGVEVDSTQDYDANNLIDTIYESNVIRRGDVVVIDEASMINEKIYKQLNDAAEELGVQIIYLGDKAQLAPVNEDKVSIVFRDPSRKVVELTQVERTGDNAILKEATAIRNGEALSKESSFNAQGEGVAYIPSTDKKGIDEIIQHFVPGLKNDSDYFKILAYTNAAVTRYNEEVRKALGYEDNVPRVGEPIIGYDNWGYLKGRKNTSTYRFINSESYKVASVGETRTVRRTLDDGTPITLQVNDVTLEGADGAKDTIMMIDVKNNPENRKNAVLLAQEKAKYWALANRSRGETAAKYRAAANEISKFLFVNDNIEDPVRKDKYGRPIVNQKKVYDFGYALTVHKSQGSTFTHVLLDDVDIQRARNKGDLEYGELNFADEGDVLNDAVDAEQAGEMEELFSVEPNDNLIQEAPAETQDESVANIKQQLEYVGMSRATDTVSVIATGVKKADTPLNHIVENPETHTKPVEQMNRRELWDYVGSWAEPMGERPIAYTPKGKEKQQYVVKDGKIYNKKGEEVNYKGKDLNKIFANLAVAEGRGVVVEYREAKYVVDNKQNITSVKSGDIVFKNENDGNRRAIIQEAEKSFRNLLAERQRRSTEITPQVVEYLKTLDIPVHNREELAKYLQENGYSSIQQAIAENREMQEIKAKAQANGTFMKAPNGKPTNLTERQWLQVRTKNFINWFGDWINDPANASKVVDENGEPKVVYHGSNNYGFTIFDPTKADDKRSLFFSSSKFIASTYTNFEPLRNNLVRQRLLKNNAVELIKNRNYEALQKLIEETLDYSLPEPGRERIYDPRYNYYIDEEIGKLKKELLKPNLSEEEVLELQADISKLEDMMWFSNNYSLKIRKIPVYRKNGQKEERIELKIDDKHKKDVESSHFIEKGIVFEGTPEQLIEAIQTETKTYSLFLNIKNPLILDNQEGEFGASNNWNRVVYQGKEYKTREISELAQKNGHDGVIFEGIIDHGGYKGDYDLNPVTDQSIAYDYFHEGEDSYTGNNIYSSNIFIAYNPNQIKSATDNNGMFSTENDDIQAFQTPEGEIYGFVDKKGDMYLDETVISSEHPIHEYTHLWDRAVAQRNPELWKKGVALMKQTSLWNEILNDVNYGKKWQAMNGMTDAKLESLIASEVHSRLVGTQGEALLDRIAKEKGSKGIVGKLKQWILDFWKELKGTFSNWSEEEINKLTLDDFNKMTVRDFADGIKLNEQSQQHPAQQQNVPASYEGMITPDANTVFVFGSNPEGRHGAGAAKTAIEKFGAVYGQGEGLQGNAYALPTKDLRVKENHSLRSISPAQITENIKKMYEVARQNPSKQFKVAYTNGLNEATLNGYTGAEMIKMFKDAGPIPPNVIFSKNWTDHWNEVQTSKQQVKGDNIASGSRGTSELAKKLTNKYNDVSVEYKGTLFKNAEHAYQTWKSGKFDQSGFDANGEKGKLPADRATNYQTMVDIITAKLQQHPDLVQGITERGGMDYLNASTHNVLGKKGDYWETSGQNKFMEALKEAYTNVITQQSSEAQSENLSPIDALYENNPVYTTDEGIAIPFAPGVKIKYPNSLGGHTFEIDHLVEDGEGQMVRGKHYDRDGKFSHIEEDSIGNIEGTKSLQIFAPDGTDITHYNENPVQEASQEEGTRVSLPGYEYFNDLYEDTLVDAEWKIEMLQELDGQLSNENTEEENQDILDQMEEILEATSQDDLHPNLTKKQQQEVETKLTDYDRLNMQIDNLNNSDFISAFEVRHAAELIMNAISDEVTKMQKEKGFAEKIFPNLKVSEDFNFQTATRKEIIQTVGIPRLLERAKELFNTEKVDFDDLSIEQEADVIYDNFDGVLHFGTDVFAMNEGFGIKRNYRTNAWEMSDAIEMNLDESGNYQDTATVEEEEDAQQHWQVEQRTLDIISTATELVRMAIHDCYQIDKNGNKVISKWGIAERVNPREAVKQIVRWTRGSQSLPDMISKLKDREVANPWLTQLINRLNDKSGNEADLQSQFYGVMKKSRQSYNITQLENKKYIVNFVNNDISRKKIFRDIVAKYTMKEHPLFEKGINRDLLGYKDKVSKDSPFTLHKAIIELDTINDSLDHNNPFTDEMRKDAVNNIEGACKILGFVPPTGVVENAITKESLSEMTKRLVNIVESLETEAKYQQEHPEEVKKAPYTPFTYKTRHSIDGSLNNFLKPIASVMDDTATNVVIEDGKMYQEEVTPSYLTLLMEKFKLQDRDFRKFIKREYGSSEWFKMKGSSPETGWRFGWLKRMAGDANAREVFDHTVELNFNKHRYMKNMSPAEYAISVIAHYFAEKAEDKQTLVPAWFRVPMQSNKPSSEFIKFYSYREAGYKNTIAEEMYNLFLQEVSRIQTVNMRNLKKKDADFIKNWDENGRQFNFLPYLNAYLSNSKEVGNLLRDEKKDAKLATMIQQLERREKVENEAELAGLVTQAIKNAMQDKADSILDMWEKTGIMEAAKSVQGIGETDAEIRDSLENFIWNDNYAAVNILQLTVGDIAAYKDADDLQKRLAELHAPGIRANVFATDYKGNLVSDGRYRTIILKDFDNFISNIVANISEVFDRKIAAAKTAEERKGLEILKDSLVRPRTYNEDGSIKDKGGKYWNINVTDAQGYSSPSSYRKKALMFGKWSHHSEEIYQKLLKGEYDFSDLETAFQPLKPFVYSQLHKDVGVRGEVESPIRTMNIPFQAKNAEYLLIMADALLKGEETSRPNLLRAVYRVMEDSERHNPTRGIDTVQFESAIKSGLQGKMDITQFMNQPGGEAGAYTYMMNRIFLRDNEGHMTKEYNTRTFVHETSYDSYCLQQEVPAHFDNHHQSQGSQERMIIPSDLDLYKDPNGNREDENNKVYYEWNDPDGTHRKEDANTFRREYEETIAANINMSLDDLAEEFQLNTQDRRLRNIALSEILQREILNNPRYGIELFQACSVDKKTGEFRIPKGDPIQAKRIEQLINSMIKTRVNKQEIAGGPIVQVSNFGTSTQLRIRFNARSGGILKAEDEFTPTAKYKTYDEYKKAEQAGIAYFEVFAPMWMKDKLFRDFADKEGNVDIDAIEMINPDLLKMISYRIPTEDKYSIAPMKIIGFMPKEAGDAIMLPYELTEIDDSDFDVDKRYVMRKEIDIAFRVEPKKDESMSEAMNSYVEHNKKSIAKHLEKAVNLQGKTTAKEREAIIKDAESAAELEKRTAKRDHENRLAKIEHRNDVAQDAIQNTKWSKDEEKDFDIYDKKAEKQEKYYDKQIARENERYQLELQKIDQRKEDTISKEIDKLAQRKVRDRIQEFLDVDRLTSSKRDDALTRELRKAYLSFMYRSMEPATGRIANNNKMLDMTWGVLTNEMTADKILNPGGFDNFKNIGYAIAAYKNSNKSWDEIRGKSIDDLKNLSSVGKDLTWVDTQVHYYQQNAAGSNLIGVFAVNKVAHATLEGDRLFIGVSDEKVCGEKPFTIAGFTFGGRMEIDPMYDANGNLVGKTIGSGVSASADTAKEPVLDLMNINMSTAGIFNSMIRLGMPMEDAALFMSQNIIKELLNEFDRQNLSGFASLDSIIAKKLKEYIDANDFSDDSNINSEPISREELIRGLKPGSDVIDYKVLLAFQNLKNIANVMRNPTFATRFNSISSAVGPQIVDNLVLEYKMDQFKNNADEDGTHIYKMDGTPVDIYTIFDMHPILNAFSKGVEVARDMFRDMPAGNTDFRIMLNALAKTVGDKTADKIRKDKQLLSKLSDFYQSYLLVQAGFMNPDEVFNFEGYESKVDKTKLRRYIEDFPKWFVEQKIQEKYPNNKLIQDIVMQNSRKTGRTFLNVPTTGLKESDKEVYRSAWTDLHKENPELSKMLFTYWFFRGGIGFTPKTAIGLVPNYVKENFTITLENGRKISYLDVFRNMETTVPEVVIDQFIRNNWEESKLVPTKGGQDTHYSYDRVTKEGILEIYNEDDIADLQDVVWMKTKTNNGMTYLWKLKGMNHKGNLEYIRVKPLGDNAEYMEMSTKNILDPMSDTTIDIEDGTPTDKAPNSPVEDEVDNSTPKNPKADAEKSKSISTMAEMIFNYMAGINRPISREAAQMKVDDIKKASNKKQFRPYLLNVLNSQGINVTMDQVLDKFEELNIC